MPPQYPQNPQVTDMDRQAANVLRGMLQAQARLDEMAKPNAPQGYTLVRETPDGGKIYRKPDGQLTFTSSGYATNNQAEIQRMIQGMMPGQARRAETNKQIVEQDGVRGAAASAIKGLPFIGEYFDEAVGMITGDPRAEAALRETTAAYEEQKPLEALGLQMGLGTVATLPLVPFQAVGNAIKAAPTMGRAMLGGMGIGAGAGAVEGAVAGFGAGEGTAEERLPSMGGGALVGGALGGALGAAAAPIEAGVRSALQNWLQSVPPDVLNLSSRVYTPGQPDPLGFITSAERALANPPARFRDAKELTADQWRKFMREGGASKEAFTYQIEPALKSLDAAGDITREAFEEAMARNRPRMQQAEQSSATFGQETFDPTTPNTAEPQFSEYVAPGPSKNYRQEVIVMPGLDYKSHNWNTKGALGHVRTTDRKAATGENVRHVEELQSDLHQEGAQYGYRGSGAATPETVAKLGDAAKKASQRLNEFERAPRKSGDEATYRELLREMQEASKRYEAAVVGQRNAPPRAPLENWEEPFVRHALQQAAKDGVNTITFPTAATLHKALKNEGTEAFYDERLPKTLERVAKSLGLKVETVDLNIGKPVSHIAENARYRIQRGDPIENPGGFDVMFKDQDTGREWGFAKQFEFKEDAERYIAERKTNINASVPAIRLTPEAKAELAKGVVMDAAGNAGRNSKRAQ
jgi:hypothetical protein